VEEGGEGPGRLSLTAEAAGSERLDPGWVVPAYRWGRGGGRGSGERVKGRGWEEGETAVRITSGVKGEGAEWGCWEDTGRGKRGAGLQVGGERGRRGGEGAVRGWEEGEFAVQVRSREQRAAYHQLPPTAFPSSWLLVAFKPADSACGCGITWIAVQPSLPPHKQKQPLPPPSPLPPTHRSDTPPIKDGKRLTRPLLASGPLPLLTDAAEAAGFSRTFLLRWGELCVCGGVCAGGPAAVEPNLHLSPTQMHARRTHAQQHTPCSCLPSQPPPP
jgi:hypothetical protein